MQSLATINYACRLHRIYNHKINILTLLRFGKATRFFDTIATLYSLRRMQHRLGHHWMSSRVCVCVSDLTRFTLNDFASREVESIVSMMLEMIVFHLFFQYFQFAYTRCGHLVFVCHQRSIEMDGKCQEDDQNWQQHYARRPCGRFAQIVEFHPTQYGNFDEKQYESEQCGEGPCCLNVPMETFMWWFVDQWNAVQIAYGFDVW